jgi:hypothetical protein
MLDPVITGMEGVDNDEKDQFIEFVIGDGDDLVFKRMPLLSNFYQ